MIGKKLSLIFYFQVALATLWSLTWKKKTAVHTPTDKKSYLYFLSGKRDSFFVWLAFWWNLSKTTNGMKIHLKLRINFKLLYSFEECKKKHQSSNVSIAISSQEKVQFHERIKAWAFNWSYFALYCNILMFSLSFLK